VSREFIEQKIGSQSIAEARRQQKELAYFTQSSIQQPITQAYLNQWVEKEYAGNDEFLNWIKTIFGGNNFLSFYKYLSFPVPSANIVNNKIRPQLERVFFSEDSFFKYTIKGQQVETPESLNFVHFDQWILNAMMFRHNDILITDLEKINTPFRDLISIDNVVALQSSKSVIERIAYTAAVPITKEDGTVDMRNGFLYMDDKEYIFYDEKVEPILTVPHDLGKCPANYIVPEPFSDDDIVRKSIFSFVNPKLKEYSFLTTLQRMTDPNGVVPVTAILRFKDKGQVDGEAEDVDSVDKAPPTPLSISSQQSRQQREVVGKESETQAGTVIDVIPRLKEDGSIDSAAVQNYIKFYHMPVESMKHLNERILQIENDIIQSVTGDFKEQNEEAQNEKQVSKGFISKEDALRKVSKGMSRIRKLSDFDMLALEFGTEQVTNDAFYGSDFFPETQNELYKLFEIAPNPIERRNILLRLSRNKNRFNRDKAEREEILITLMPYSADVDFNTAVDNQRIDSINFQYYTRFPYWIGIFEATYGDIVIFFNDFPEGTSNEARLTSINNLIKDLITKAGIPEPPKPEPVNTPTT
jgi:hypothetical protein